MKDFASILCFLLILVGPRVGLFSNVPNLKYDQHRGHSSLLFMEMILLKSCCVFMGIIKWEFITTIYELVTDFVL